MFSDDTELFPLSTLLYNREHAIGGVTDFSSLPSAGNVQGQNVWATHSTVPGARIIAWMSSSTPDDLWLKPFDFKKIILKRAVNGQLTDFGVVNEGEVKEFDGFTVALGVDPYWRQFGIEYVELPENTPLVHAMWERICLRVNEAYYDRFLGGETLEQWQRRLQVITDRIIPRYERNFRIYDANKTKLENELGMTQITEYLDVKDVSSTTNESRVNDTPDTAVNVDDDYAGSVAKGQSGTENTKTGKVKTSMTPNGGLIQLLNDNMDAWRDLESDLVDEYAKAFLSVIWF